MDTTEPFLDDIVVSQDGPRKRTLPVTVICILYMFFIILLLVQIFSSPHTLPGKGKYLLLASSLLIAGLLWGLWKMKKWAAITFMVLLAAGIVMGLSRGAAIYSSVINLAVVIVVYTQLKKMG